MEKDTASFNASQSSIRAGKRLRDLSGSQEVIYSFLLEIVKSWQPDRTLEHFQQLFLYNTLSSKFPSAQALQNIVIGNDQEIFIQTLKRSCYILINNWDRLRLGTYIKQLVDSFQDPALSRSALSTLNQRLRFWLREFINSSDYQELRVFANRFEDKTTKKKHWSDRYAHYLLISQSADTNNSSEQRDAARTLTEKVRQRFRLDLALYVAHTQNPVEHQNSRNFLSAPSTVRGKTHDNPTGLGETTLHLIKSLVMRKGMFSQDNLARIFLEQVKGLSYFSYKQSLFNYLIYSNESKSEGFILHLKQKLRDRLNSLYPDWEEEETTAELMLRTCNQMINFLTTENNQQPSTIFALLISQGHSLILGILLLKLILISPSSRSHLDLRISSLVRFYQGHDPNQSEWFGHFLDIINVTLAIYTEGVEYNLIHDQKTSSQDPESPHSFGETNANLPKPLESYKIFAQVRNAQKQSPLNPNQERSNSPPHGLSPTRLEGGQTLRYDAITGEEIIWQEPMEDNA